MDDDQLPDLPPGAFARIDESADADFYLPVRLVTHIDDTAIAALAEFYGKMLKPGDAVLDIMSSWVSHLPDDIELGEVIGHGMNEGELAENPQLTRYFVQDLNCTSALPVESSSMDAALCCVSVQYLQQPIDVFAEVRRVLRPGAPFIVSFSNRCFPTKAVAIWRSLDFNGHASLVHLYMTKAGFSEVTARMLMDGHYSDPLYVVVGRA